MADLIGCILVGYAAALWAQGYRAENREEIRILLSVRDEDLNIICDLLKEWEKED